MFTGGRLNFTLMCTFLVKAESGGYQTWICGYRYEERLAQQESGAALSNSSISLGLTPVFPDLMLVFLFCDSLEF